MLGAILSWGILWPVIQSKKGDWYPANTDSSSMQGLYGYKIFITLSIFMVRGPHSHPGTAVSCNGVTIFVI